MGEVLAVRDAYRVQEWARLIQECSASGLTKREFCQQRGISEKSFYYWLRKLRMKMVGSAEIDELKRKLEHMNEILLNAQRARFGQSSEKNTYVLQEQTSLFNEAESSQDHKADEPKPDTIFVEAHERKKKRSQAEMLKHLPEEEVLLEIPEEQRLCSKCGGKMKPIGKKFLRHEMQIIPKQIKLLAYYAVTYACDRCEKDTGFAHIISVQPPVPLMKHSLASPSTVAYIMTQKYVDGLPLARQEKVWAREGVSLSRATMANWVIQCSEVWLKPLYRHMKQELLTHCVIHADETVVQVLKEDEELETLMPWAPHIQQDYKMPNSDAYEKCYLD